MKQKATDNGIKKGKKRLFSSLFSMNSKMSLRTRIVLHMFVFISIIIAALWLMQSVFLDDIYMAIKKRELYITGENVVSSIKNEDYGDELRDLAFEEKACIFIYDITNKDELVSIEGLNGVCDIHSIVYRKVGNLGFELNLTGINEIASRTSALGNKALFRVENTVDPNVKYPMGRRDENQTGVILSIITKGNSGEELLVVLNSIISPLASTVETLNTMLIYISAILIVLAIIFSTIISMTVSRPIYNINSAAKELAKGNYGVEFEEKGFSEVVELAQTLNYASKELSKVDRLKTELVSNISHDLRTPITLISGYAEMMRDIPDEMSAENLQIIIDESARMKSLVNDVLDISKLQSGNAEFENKTVALTNCIESELTRYNKFREKEGYKIDFIFDKPVFVKGDSARLMQVLYNLVNNAVTHSGSDKTVTVVQEVISSKVRISVRDSGEGISEEDMPYIWDRYYKVDKSHKRAREGSGLGLSIVKTVIEAHGGKCGVLSKQGQGSTFWFELELADTPE